MQLEGVPGAVKTRMMVVAAEGDGRGWRSSLVGSWFGVLLSPVHTCSYRHFRCHFSNNLGLDWRRVIVTTLFLTCCIYRFLFKEGIFLLLYYL